METPPHTSTPESHAPLLYPAMTAPPITACVTCQTPVSGPYCSQCGAPTGPRKCRSCAVDLSPGARFCHHCGSEAVPGGGVKKERTAWIAVAVGVIATVAVVAYFFGRGQQPAPTGISMGNAGNANPTTAGRAPDISQMSPRERFDRLFGRIMRAAEANAADTVMLFSPMALEAYRQLLPAELDADARYHAAMIHMVVGEFAEARAKADTILANQPNHLFGLLVQGEVALQENNSAAVAKIYRQFLAAYDAEIAAGRKEYSEHQPVLTDFKNRARAVK